MTSYIIEDVVAFFDIGTDNVIIHRIKGVTDLDTTSYYGISVDREFGPTNPNYYLMDENEKIHQLFNKLKECGSEIVKTTNEPFLFKLVAPKFYEVAKKKEDQKKGLRVALVYDESPIGVEYIDDISKLPLKEYEEVFGHYEQEGKGGFPIF
jgi:hypothetical protein